MDSGYIKLWRAIQDSKLWISEPFTKAQAWIDLLLMANHKDKEICVRGIFITVKRGQLARSQESLAKKWHWSRNKLVNFLKLLKTEQQIVQQKVQQNCRLINIISIVNYSHYQTTIEKKVEQKVEQKVDKRLNKRFSNNNEKNENNVENLKKKIYKKEKSINLFDKEFEFLIARYPNSTKRKMAYRHFCATVTTEQDVKRINRAMDNYLAMLKQETWRKPQSAVTWFNNWDDWENQEVKPEKGGMQEMFEHYFGEKKETIDV